jgi:hypothetical protein
MTQFIKKYEKAFSEDFCKRVIEYFDNMEKSGATYNRQQGEGVSKLSKDDLACFPNEEKDLKLDSSLNLVSEFNTTFWNKYGEYEREFSMLSNFEPLKTYTFKIQKTEIGGGYHIWHCESGARAQSNRVAVWMLYLNDVEEGGETEFLYQHKRFKPTTGDLIIWPAGYTHTHRGNPPLSNTKYVVTGWIEF